MIKPTARERSAIGRTSASPTYSDAEENPPHKNAVSALMSYCASVNRQTSPSVATPPTYGQVPKLPIRTARSHLGAVQECKRTGERRLEERHERPSAQHDEAGCDHRGRLGHALHAHDRNRIREGRTADVDAGSR